MKNKLFDSPVLNRPHPVGDGVQRIYQYENGFGASVIRFRGSYTSNNEEWELAVIKSIDDKDWGKDNDNWELTYETNITEDVIGHLIEDKVEKILKRIKEL